MDFNNRRKLNLDYQQECDAEIESPFGEEAQVVEKVSHELRELENQYNDTMEQCAQKTV